MSQRRRSFLLATSIFILLLPLLIALWPWFKAQILVATGAVALIVLTTFAALYRKISLRGMMLVIAAFAMIAIGVTTPYSRYMIAEKITLRITVKDRDTDRVIPGATVSVAELAKPSAPCAYCETTDESGAVAIELEGYTTVAEAMLIRTQSMQLDRKLLVEAKGYQSETKVVEFLKPSDATSIVYLRQIEP